MRGREARVHSNAGTSSTTALILTAGLAIAAFSLRAAAQKAGPVTGVIDGIDYAGDHYYVHGWAYQEAQRSSIDVHIYAGGPAGQGGTLVTAGTANFSKEHAIDHQCRDAKGGKHRFAITLDNQLLRSLQGKRLWAQGIDIAGNMENAAIAVSENFKFPAPKWPPDPPTPHFLEGKRVEAFDTRKDSCEEIDIPDAAARAFRDYKGTIHLISSHYITRAALGSTLESAKHDCQVVYNSAHDANIADFNDPTWLNAFHNVDGKKIVAVGHMEYHGWEHPGMCKVKTETAACWYNVGRFNISEDGGYHFTRPVPPGNYFISTNIR